MEALSVIDNKKENQKKYILFKVKDGNYGIDINSVNSVIQMPHITEMPMTPDHYKGIIDLRGQIVPIVSVRKRIDFESEDVYTKDSRIIITEIEKDTKLGFIVDSVQEVITIPNDEIKESSPFLKGKRTMISGVGKVNDNLVSIFDIEMLA